MLACALCLLAGLLLGRLSSDPGADATEPGNTPASERSATRTGGTNADGRARHLSKKRVTAQPEQDDTLATASGLHAPAANGPLVVVPASVLSNLSSQLGVRTFAQDLFSNDGRDEAGLQITDQEKAKVQRAWQQIRAKVKKLETGACTTRDLPDGTVQISLPDLTEAMTGLGGEFKSASADVLGDNRAEAFRAIKQTDKLFHRQKGEQTVTVKMEAIGNGLWRYHIVRRSGGQTVSQTIGSTIPASLRHLTDKAGIRPALPTPAEEPED